MTAGTVRTPPRRPSGWARGPARWPRPSRRPSPTRSPRPPARPSSWCPSAPRATARRRRSSSSAAPASSSPRSARRCWPARSTWPCTATRTCPPRRRPGLILAAVPGREDPRDVLVARDGLTLGELPTGATIGTGAPRRAAQLRALGLGLEVVADPRQRRHPARPGRRQRGAGRSRRRRPRPGGAVPPRPARRGHRDARPAAGAARARRRGRSPSSAAPATPAPASCSAGSSDPATRACVVAERSVLAALEAGCSAPVAAYAEIADGDDRPRTVPARLGDRDRRERLRPRFHQRPARRRRRRSAGRSRPNCSTAARPRSSRSVDRDHTDPRKSTPALGPEPGARDDAHPQDHRLGRHGRLRRRRTRRPRHADRPRAAPRWPRPAW